MAKNVSTQNIMRRASKKVSGFADRFDEDGLARARNAMDLVGAGNNSAFVSSASDAYKKVKAGRELGKSVRTFRKKRKIKRAQKKGQMI